MVKSIYYFLDKKFNKEFLKLEKIILVTEKQYNEFHNSLFHYGKETIKGYCNKNCKKLTYRGFTLKIKKIV